MLYYLIIFTKEDKMTHKSLYVVDNSSETRSVRSYLSQWCSISKQMDIAAGYFEIGGLLCLD